MEVGVSTQAPVQYLLTVRDARKLKHLATHLERAWADMQNPFSLVYDEIVSSGFAATVARCAPFGDLTIHIENAGSCGEKARLKVSVAAASVENQSCRDFVQKVIEAVILPHLPADLEYEVERLAPGK